MNEIEKAIANYKRSIEYINKDLELQDEELYKMDKPTRDEMERAKKDHLLAISALEKQLTNGWISVKERLPEDKQNIIVTGNGKVACLLYLDNKFWNGMLDQTKLVTHWQPLPEPYTEVSNDN